MPTLTEFMTCGLFQEKETAVLGLCRWTSTFALCRLLRSLSAHQVLLIQLHVMALETL